MGGAWVRDTGCGEGSLPLGVVDEIVRAGKEGVVISGVVTWIDAQIGTWYGETL